MTGQHDADTVFISSCEVVSVDLSTRTCDCTILDGKVNADLPGVRLMAALDDGLLIEPVVGSVVSVVYSKQVDPFVAQYSEIANITIISSGQIIFNGSAMGGMVKVIDLTQKLNKLENTLNDLITKFNSHTHILTLTSGTGTAAPTVAPETGTITPTQQADIEDKNIVHG